MTESLLVPFLRECDTPSAEFFSPAGAQNWERKNPHFPPRWNQTTPNTPLSRRIETTMMMKTLIAILLCALLSEISAFSLRKPSLSFLGRKAAPSQLKTTSEATRTQEKQSLDEFNALCQRVIAEERQQQYYAFVAECSRLPRKQQQQRVQMTA
jgi:hypothetical protein